MLFGIVIIIANVIVIVMIVNVFVIAHIIVTKNGEKYCYEKLK